ncbi:stealth conserved region 3 domain-containing protein [Rahnella sp. WP5]|uniref:stealth conserved region 3 domain-containing protein n=1 Tax=Rahnella sp. WP5 TaxID=1500266 RepID=UPI00056649F9|nr:stealth conserved region 3 domain-containing protein [Rahnella sp. WP5]
MANSIYKKISKLFRDPNMFFYDMFRKRAFKGAPPKTKKITSQNNISAFPTINALEVQNLGLVNYLRRNLKAGLGPKDGSDCNSLLLWAGYLGALINFISGLKSTMTMNITIYTLGGGYSYTSTNGELFDSNQITKNLNSKPDFVIELSNELGDLYILHFYLFDLDVTGLATVRSNKSWVRKFPLEELENIYSPEKQTKERKIDAVYTWVNHADLAWQEQWKNSFPDSEFDPDRYTSNDELKYSLRSLNKYAPWLNNIYIVSNCAKPSWLTNHPRIIWVDHNEIFPYSESLPTFNSHAIESCLHHIKDLSEYFIYLNDDFILGQPCLPSDFFDEAGRSLAYFEPYGMVYSSSDKEGVPDYLLAAMNSNKLIKEQHPEYDSKYLHRHVPYALRKSVLMEIERTYPESFSITRNSKIRSPLDINLTSFLYHHYSYINGTSVKSEVSSLIVRPNNINSILSKDSYKYKILCFNDGNGSADDIAYKKSTQQYLDKRLSEKAPWEVIAAS